MDVHTLAREGMPEALDYLHPPSPANQRRADARSDRYPSSDDSLPPSSANPIEPACRPGCQAFARKSAIYGDSTRQSCVALARRELAYYLD